MLEGITKAPLSVYVSDPQRRAKRLRAMERITILGTFFFLVSVATSVWFLTWGVERETTMPLGIAGLLLLAVIGSVTIMIWAGYEHRVLELIDALEKR